MSASICKEIAQALFEACLLGDAWSTDELRRLVNLAGTPEGSQALFGTLAEGLSDRFEARLVDAYASMFSQVLAWALPEFDARELRARFERARRPRFFEGDPATVFVLSRVTLGADIAVTSVLLDAAKRRFPAARIVLVGPAKSQDLFAADPRIEHLRVEYGRSGTLDARLAAGHEMRTLLDRAGSIVIDPDSRLTQLGLLPVCEEYRYLLFDSRSPREEGSLAVLAARWAERVLGIADARPYLAPAPASANPAAVALSLGVGDNPAKRVPDPFEIRLPSALAQRAGSVLIDSGAGGEEAERVARAAAGPNIRIFRGSFAEFASLIARSRLYAGYDSAGQHAAAALGIPVVSVFSGYPCARFVERWHPGGPAPVEVVLAADLPPEQVLRQALDAAERLLT